MGAVGNILQEHVNHAVLVIWDYWKSGGWLMLPLAGVAFCIFYRYLLLLSHFPKSSGAPGNAALQMEKLACRDREFRAVRQWLERKEGPAPRVARHALARVAAGEPFQKVYRECREAELDAYPSSFTLLAGLVAAAPLLGLLGTVLGMIETFTAVGSGGADTARLVAAGISKALITTQAGLAIAVAGTFGLSHLRRLLRNLRHELDHWESHLKLIINGSPKPEA